MLSVELEVCLCD